MPKKTRKPARKGKTSPNKDKKFPPEPLTDDEARRLLKACSDRAPTGIRNRALLAVMYRCGLRCDEALALKPKDIEPKAGKVLVLHGKGDESRTVGIDAGALALVQRWTDKRTAMGINGRATLFCTLKGKKMSTAYIRQLLPRLARKAGIEKRVHAHGLRHTHAAELAAENTPINVIQAVLGHRNIATTSRYLDHIAPTQVIERMRNREWDL